MASRAAVRQLERFLAAVRQALPAITGLGANGDRALGRYYGTYIASTFQPWRAASDGGIVACEAYARSHSKNGSDMSPWQLFADAAVDADLVTLDRLCRTVHAINYFSRDDVAQPLVLNVDARLLHAVPERHGEFFGKVLSLLGVAPPRIVIEIHTSHLLDLTCLKQVLASYRRHGFAVAVNAESFVHANSLAQLLVPDVLMLRVPAFSRESVARQVASLKSTGVRIAVKHVETAEDYALAAAAGVDWVQGFHLDRPDGDPASFAAFKP
jgi:EAL domain-containing protein (putative c-di-GMP-specific phosphodiesterase class I)